MSTKEIFELLLVELLACGGAFAVLNGLLLGLGITGPAVVTLLVVGLVLIGAGTAVANVRAPLPANA